MSVQVRMPADPFQCAQTEQRKSAVQLHRLQSVRFWFGSCEYGKWDSCKSAAKAELKNAEWVTAEAVTHEHFRVAIQTLQSVRFHLGSTLDHFGQLGVRSRSSLVADA